MFDNGSVLADEIESLLVITVSSISVIPDDISRNTSLLRNEEN